MTMLRLYTSAVLTSEVKRIEGSEHAINRNIVLQPTKVKV